MGIPADFADFARLSYFSSIAYSSLKPVILKHNFSNGLLGGVIVSNFIITDSRYPALHYSDGKNHLLVITPLFLFMRRVLP